jgi:hypothetical protein
MTDHDRCRAVIAALEGYMLGRSTCKRELLSDALDLLRRYGPNGGPTPKAEPETCPKNCRHLTDEDGCDFCYLPGTDQCRAVREGR